MAWNLLGVAVNYVLIGLIAAAITVIARTFIVPLVMLAPLVLGLTISLVGVLPILTYLPDLAGLQLLTAYPGIGLLGPVPGASWSRGPRVSLPWRQWCLITATPERSGPTRPHGIDLRQDDMMSSRMM